MKMVNINMKKRAVSPVIATVLLIVITIILFFLVFVWAKSFIKEALIKKDVPVDQVCERVILEVNYLSEEGVLQISNIGNYPVYYNEIRIKKGGSTDIVEDKQPILIGSSIEIIDINEADAIEVIPVVLAQNDKGKKVAYTCQKNPISANII